MTLAEIARQCEDIMRLIESGRTMLDHQNQQTYWDLIAKRVRQIELATIEEMEVKDSAKST